jgi:hypothetical protein
MIFEYFSKICPEDSSFREISMLGKLYNKQVSSSSPSSSSSFSSS